ARRTGIVQRTDSRIAVALPRRRVDQGGREEADGERGGRLDSSPRTGSRVPSANRSDPTRERKQPLGISIRTFRGLLALESRGTKGMVLGTRDWGPGTEREQEAEEHVSFEPIRNGKCDRGLRCHSHLPGLSGKNPQLVAWRGDEARDHQLPNL